MLKCLIENFYSFFLYITICRFLFIDHVRKIELITVIYYDIELIKTTHDLQQTVKTCFVSEYLIKGISIVLTWSDEVIYARILYNPIHAVYGWTSDEVDPRRFYKVSYRVEKKTSGQIEKTERKKKITNRTHRVGNTFSGEKGAEQKSRIARMVEKRR